LFHICWNAVSLVATAIVLLWKINKLY
jgi:hypothetical protein